MMILLLVILGIILIAAYNRGNKIVELDKENWNKGKCHDCGYHWTLDGYDRELGRLYKCTKCGATTNVVTLVDKEYIACEDPDHPDYIDLDD